MDTSPAASAFIEQLRTLIPGILDAKELAAAITPDMRAASLVRVNADLRNAIAGELATLLAERRTTEELAAIRDRVALDGDVPDVVASTVKAAVEEAMTRALATIARGQATVSGTPASDANTLLTVEEVAARLGVSKRSVLRSKIPVVRIGRSRRYRPADVDAFAGQQRQRPAVVDAAAVARRLASGRRARPR